MDFPFASQKIQLVSFQADNIQCDRKQFPEGKDLLPLQNSRNVTLGATLSHWLVYSPKPRGRVNDRIMLERKTSLGGAGRVTLHQRTWDSKIAGS
ncbi:hypothetical protein PG994_006553 [Apiospora phragmitis]|uniref:Uncharacterized protein n=1 Tax=Apiospora phragmitis TaxID=2905665 RepID=A0ABR1VGC2_9PEZI